jgi:hypothetical protein
VVFQRFPPHDQDEGIGRLDPLVHFQLAEALGCLDEPPGAGECPAEQRLVAIADGEKRGFHDHAARLSHFMRINR